MPEDPIIKSSKDNRYILKTPIANASPQLNPTTNGAILLDTGSNPMNILIQTIAGEIYISSSDHFTSTVIANLTVGSGIDEMTVGSTTGNISIDPFNNIDITNAISTAGSVFIISQNDITFSGSGSIAAGGQVDLVVDNQAPSPPLIGGGSFVMDVGSSITSGGTLRIFTARQNQNSISGSLNTMPFSNGVPFMNTNQEQWGFYFNTLINGTPFTIFYKDVLSELAFQGDLVVTDLLRNLHPYDEPFGWKELYQITYLEFFEPFYLERKKLFNHPKSYSERYPD